MLNLLLSTGIGLCTAGGVALLKQAVIAGLLPTHWTVGMGLVVIAIAMLFWVLWMRGTTAVLEPFLSLLVTCACIVVGLGA